ncbi:MAG: CDP-diacylglycerol--glycerol-3-phosphate 3-phosphatidyltransferase [Endomicrobium sp.]|jgi:CDP-diacylglycerol--glycerol-3-phosphate 3-phosphatidyltransferase|nr:CDP-diacylglycerol--glycerol-3-phosphate 3-phosphatidyltransferase [Endomicrobium sp.]
MNLPNKLTVARMCIVPLFIFFMEMRGIYNNILALFVFCIAAITDFLDGQIARRNKAMTATGALLDPLADKLLIFAAFICFVGIPSLGIPAWMVIIIVAREFLITGLRSVAVPKNMIVSADKSGKFKTTSQMIVIILILTVLIMNELLYSFISNNRVCYSCVILLRKLPFWATVVATIFTIYSGLNYVWKYRRLLLNKDE